MIINYDKVIEIFSKYPEHFGGTTPREALAINFVDNTRSKETLTYTAKGGHTLAIDLDEDGKVIGIEIC
jgi:hypothetical protein